jgi:hypothetical protein
MFPHGTDIGAYVRGALVEFCGLTAAWIKDHFSHRQRGAIPSTAAHFGGETR